ncbi:MAG: signal peptide peptidase SppA [Bacteroidales bacterium]|nr:signal peptide peptidase SppA [Bacteroidales bacterium]MDD3907007.1 signal peptide peptidase SppA [Bacteroidales bacterium]MDD4712933.1 signal peptide peptidase SppA [Bacteroidales bacterium]
MKQFFKFTLASFVGVIIALLFFSLIIISIAGAISSTDRQYRLKDNSFLKISLNGELKEQSVDNPFNLTIPGLPVDTKMESQGLDDILSAISKAKTNDQIKGIYIDVKTLSAGFSSIEEIRNALIEFKKSGKKIYAYGDTYDQREYYICSVADKIFINPQGMMNFCGLAATPVFYKGTLDKLGVKAEIFRVGTFKSAVEPYLNTKMSEASKLQTKEYIGGIWGHLLKGISASRNISTDELNTLANKNMLFQPTEELIKNKLVDSILYESGMRAFLAKKAGVDDFDDLNLVSVSDFLTIPGKSTKFVQDKIAILYAEGEIFDEGTEGIVRDDMISEIEKIKKDETIKAVVFRVNSPGGSAYASEQIWKAISDLKAVKPVVVSMGDYAASGGYYISCNANKIIASPNTITGSIGIFGTFFILDKLADKVGLSFDVVKTNDMSDLGNITRPMTEIEKHKIQNYIEKGYDLFVKRCSEGRKMDSQKLRKIAEGRVWTGEKAVELGLADELGGIDHAIKVAAKLGKVKNYRMVSFPEKKNFMTQLMEEFEGKTKMHIALSYFGEEYAPLLKLKEAKIQTGILARMENMDIH